MFAITYHVGSSLAVVLAIEVGLSIAVAASAGGLQVGGDSALDCGGHLVCFEEMWMVCCLVGNEFVKSPKE